MEHGVSQPRLVELDGEVAETMIRRKELLLSKTDEVSMVICTHGGSKGALNIIPSPNVYVLLQTYPPK